MLTDIALGQYYPGNSLIHKLDPRTKILITLFFIVAIFLASGAVSYGILWGFVFLIILFITSAADAGSKINKAAVDHHCSDNGNPYVYRAG